MALTRTNQIGAISSSAHGTGAFTTSSFTPPDNSLLVVAAGGVENSGTTNPSNDLTISGGGLTFTRQTVIGHTTSWTMGLAIWTAPVTTGASMTLSVDCAARNMWWLSASAVAYTGYDTGAPIGATGTLVDVTTPDGAQSFTLSGAPATDSEVFASLLMDKEGLGTTPGAAFTEIHDLQVGTEGGLETEIRTGSTSTTVDWVDCHTGTGNMFTLVGAAVEIKAAASGPPPTPPTLRVVRSNTRPR